MAGFKQGGIEFRKKSVIGNPTTGDHILFYGDLEGKLVLKNQAGDDIVVTESLLRSISGDLQTQLDNLDLNYATDASVANVSGSLYTTIQTVSGALQFQIDNLSGDFLGLTDTPSTYSGADSYVLTVSGGGIGFIPQSQIIPTLTEASLSGVLDDRYVNATGDTMTGTLTISSGVGLNIPSLITSEENVIQADNSGNLISSELQELYVPVENITDSDAEGEKGQWSYAQGYLYRCIASDTWVKFPVIIDTTSDLYELIDLQVVSLSGASGNYLTVDSNGKVIDSGVSSLTTGDLQDKVTGLISISGQHDKRITDLETQTIGITGGLTQLDDRFVNVTGDTMTGDLILASTTPSTTFNEGSLVIPTGGIGVQSGNINVNGTVRCSFLAVNSIYRFGDTNTGIDLLGSDEMVLKAGNINMIKLDEGGTEQLIINPDGENNFNFSILKNGGDIAYIYDGGTTDTHTFNSDISVTGDTNIDGKLTVFGNIIQISGGNIYTQLGETVQIQDNLVVLNYGEQGNGISLNQSGVQIDRGTADDYFFIFDETIDNGTFVIGVSGDLKPVSAREVSPINGAFSFWNDSERRFDTSSVYTSGSWDTISSDISNLRTDVDSISGQVLSNDMDISNLQTSTSGISGDLNIVETYINGITGGLTQLDDRFVNVTGDTMTGDLTIEGSLTVNGAISGVSYTPVNHPYLDYWYNTGTPTNVQDALDYTARETFFSKHIALQQSSTSVNQGGDISISGSDSVTVESGLGYWIDHTSLDSSNINPTLKKVTWGTQVVQIPNISGGEEFSFVFVDADSGDVGFKQSEPTPEDYRNKFLLGKVIHRNGTADFVVPLKPIGSDVFNQFSDLAHAIGTINIEGNIWSAANPSVDLTLKKTAGKSFRLNSQVGNLDNPHTTTDPSFDTSIGGDTFSYVHRLSGGGVVYINGQTEADPDAWDDGNASTAGDLPSIPDGGFFTFNQYTVQRIYSFPKPSTGGGGKNYIFYGQKVYSTLDNALEGIETEEFELPAENFYDASLRGWLIMRRDITDFSNDTQHLFVTAGKFGENAGGTSLSAETRSLFRDDLFRIESNGDPTSFLRFSLQNILDTGETINIQANSAQNGDIDLTLPAISGQLVVQSQLDDILDGRYVNVTGDTMTGPLTITDTTQSGNSTTGALIVSGGIGVQGNIRSDSLISTNGQVYTGNGLFLDPIQFPGLAFQGNVNSGLYYNGGDIGITIVTEPKLTVNSDRVSVVNDTDLTVTNLASISGNFLTTDVNGTIVDSGENLLTLGDMFVNVTGDTMTGSLTISGADLILPDLITADDNVTQVNTTTGKLFSTQIQELYVPVEEITSSSSTGIKGQWSYGLGYFYYCIATNTWVKYPVILDVQTNTYSVDLSVAGSITATGNISGSAFYGDGSNLTNLSVDLSPYATISLINSISGDLDGQIDAISTELQVVSGGLQTQIDDNFNTFVAISGQAQVELLTTTEIDQDRYLRPDGSGGVTYGLTATLSGASNALVVDQSVPYVDPLTTGIKGQWSYDGSEYWVCVATDTWIEVYDKAVLDPILSGFVTTTFYNNLFVDISNITDENSTGIKGQWSYSNGYRYECVATDTWVRFPVETSFNISGGP
jgi:hypothetical protein